MRFVPARSSKAVRSVVCPLGPDSVVGATHPLFFRAPAAADGHQEANAAAAAAVGAAVIVLQHPPGEPPLERAIWRLLGPRLRRVDAGGEPAGGGRSLDPLLELRRGMGRLAERDADRQLALVLQGLVEARD